MHSPFFSEGKEDKAIIEQIGEEEPFDIEEMSVEHKKAFISTPPRAPKSALSRLINPYEERKEATSIKKKRGNKLLEMFFGDTVVRIRSRKIIPKSETGEVDLFAPLSEEDEEVAKNITTTMQQTISSSFASLRSSSKQLFSKAVFKGVGISLVKSVSDWKSCGIGIKVPVTAHFPVYDSNICLPRLIGFVGLNYPFSYKASLTFSVPIQALQIFYYVVLRTKPVRWPVVKATDNVKRVGITWSWKLSPSNAKPWFKSISGTVGPTFIFLPGIPMIKMLLPFIILIPALIFGSIGYVLSMYRGFCDAIIFSLTVDMLRNGEFSVTKQTNEADWTQQHAGHPVQRSPVRSRKDPFILENTLWNQFFVAWKHIETFFSTKTPAFGGSASFANKVLGGSVNFDIQPLYFTRICRLVVFLFTLIQQVILYSLFYLFDSIHSVNVKSTTFWDRWMGKKENALLTSQQPLEQTYPQPNLEEVWNELSNAFIDVEELNPPNNPTINNAKEPNVKVPSPSNHVQSSSSNLSPQQSSNVSSTSPLDLLRMKSDSSVVVARHQS